MAVDKLVDSSQLDTDLTSVADAIRTKGGTTASLSFPVGFVSAISAISGGGGASFGTGTLTPAADTATCQIDIGGNYDHFVLFRDDQSATTTRCLRAAICDFAESNQVRCIISTNNSGTAAIMESYGGTTGVTKSGTVVTYSYNNAKLKTGFVHRWVAW